MAKNEKNNAPSPRPVPKKIAVNGGTEGSVPTPQNLGVPTPALPFDPQAAMGALGAPAGPSPVAGHPDAQMVQQVQGMIFHWSAEELRNLITFAAHLLTQQQGKPTDASPDAGATPPDSTPAQ